MVESLLYYKNFLKTLNMTGLQLNLYDTCVASTILNDKQQIIWFQVDKWKLIYKDSKANNEFISTLNY